MAYFNIIAALSLAYLIGSIPTSVWVGKLFYGIDIRTVGSGNAGATNVIRVLGLKAGIPVLLFDIFKGWAAVQLIHLFPVALPSETGLVLFQISLGILVVLGHVFPVFAGFRGGKGVATLLGVGSALFPAATGIALGIFILVFLLFRYVSLASILAALLFPFIQIFLLNHREVLPLTILAIAVAVFIPITHRKNILRLVQGKESRLLLRKGK
ncbi:MAG TPA: glycerol-3-phosphate 1-O-acyltransferase PlsY [Bacteroidales bacterium]|nr:glycerol-3-phosphate 1-O-acyltransferase PlsY [Bacteroidales bacterium]HNS46917.1 glycerol-3-phosphate 1-O-acyltransferase PlsY [Bacteroidales bacterium]